ncbi:MAG TPA: MBL fold metallo-hydrolase [Thermoleophilaceae bacterium]|jgi:L-ascorbate metabolism protein UlaG (beta-lactamase superfamily)
MVALTYVGGPTAVLEWAGLRLLTDPTFDPAGSVYELPGYTLRKTQDPAIAPAEVGPVDAVLLSHEHHLDNLDRAGRKLSLGARQILTTKAAAEILGERAVGLEPWDSVELSGGLRATATPARHGPAGGDRGPAIGFALSRDAEVVYFSGDTVWYEGVQEVADRFRVNAALLCTGAAKVSVAGDDPLTLTASEAVEVARAMPDAIVVPLHYEGWAHFTESRADLERAFDAAALAGRLRFAAPAEPLSLELQG